MLRFKDPAHFAALLRGDYGPPPAPRPEPTYCMFCSDVPEDELREHGGCKCCGNNGAFD